MIPISDTCVAERSLSGLLPAQAPIFKVTENLAKAGDLSPLRTFCATQSSKRKLTRYMAVFLGSPNVSVIPQVFLNSSFGICATMPKLAYCGTNAQGMHCKSFAYRVYTCESSMLCCHPLHTSLSLATSRPSVSRKMDESSLGSNSSSPVSLIILSDKDRCVMRMTFAITLKLSATCHAKHGQPKRPLGRAHNPVS